jgi:5-formyltetrahydrofolate cyclo-ligase
MIKQMLRLQMKQKLHSLSLTPDKKNSVDQRLYLDFIHSSFYRDARCIFTYVSHLNEINTYQIIQTALTDQKKVSVPKINPFDKKMYAIEISSLNELYAGYYGIMEPLSFEREISPYEIDLVLVPGLAFDHFGGRLGYGGGYYDKFLSQNRNVYKVSLAYDFQIVDHVPMEEHDIRIDLLMV